MPEAEILYRRAAERGCQQAQLLVGRILHQRGDLAGCEEIYGVGVAAGWPPAMYYLANARSRLQSDDAGFEDARVLLERAASSGDVGAEMDLAIWSARGRFGWRRWFGAWVRLWIFGRKTSELHDRGALELRTKQSPIFLKDPAVDEP